MTTNYTALIQKYRQQRNPPKGSTGQIPMPTGATTGNSFPLPPANTSPTTQAQGYMPPTSVPGPVLWSGILTASWRNFRAALPWGTVLFAVILFGVIGLLMRAIWDGDVRLFQKSTASIAAAPVFVVVTATPQPTAQPPTAPAPIIIAPTTPPVPVYVERVTQPQPAQRAERRVLPQPQAAAPTAWPAPPTGTAKGAMGYQCADGRYFPADGPFGWGPFGVWVTKGEGDVIDIRDTLEQSSTMGWHTKCQRVWR